MIACIEQIHTKLIKGSDNKENHLQWRKSSPFQQNHKL
jgi:hypothetical protein